MSDNLIRKGRGRPKGSLNKTTGLLRDAILEAAKAAGGRSTKDREGGLIGYLRIQAAENPGPFMALLGKVLPTQVTGEDGGPLKIETVRYADDPHSS